LHSLFDPLASDPPPVFNSQVLDLQAWATLPYSSVFSVYYLWDLVIKLPDKLQGKIFETYTAENVLVSRIYKELLKLMIRRQITHSK
jgi:hypothetical protein